MKILHLSSARSLGGGERHLSDLANGLALRGHEVYAALVPQSPLREKLAALPASNIIELRLRNALDVASAMELARFVLRQRVEIVHAHMARDYPLAALATRRKETAALVITRHVLFPLSRLHTITLSHAARVIAVSRAVERSLAAQGIFRPGKLALIPNGIDFRRFGRERDDESRRALRLGLKIEDEGLLVGTVGELNPLKGHEAFLYAAASVLRRLPDTHFIIAGQDPTRTGEHRAGLERLIAELGLAGR
ncbi:MAG TPA: glycosyltransferase, partial [Pyrinomonadaceae bacterium]